MFVYNIKAKNFRNYSEFTLNFSKELPINIILAPNGMGKTNLLESIYYLSHMHSFRSVLDTELIKKGESSFFLECSYYKNSISNTISINYNKKKEVFFNNKRFIKLSEIFGEFLTVLFCNEDIFIINGSPLIKRKFFDIFISIVDKNYLYHLKQYINILKQKNFLLKNKNNNKLISVYNIQLSQSIYYIQQKRKSIINEINNTFQENFLDISLYQDKVKIIYSPSIPEKITEEAQKIYMFLENIKEKEINNGYSIYGIHRDNFYFIIKGINFSKYASFGQTRLASLVLKLLQIEYYKKIFKIEPILLLDDVILELDKEKKDRFINKISEYAQIFITITEKEFLKLFKNQEKINLIEIINGKIK